MLLLNASALVILVIIQLSWAQDCRGPWNNFRSCMKSHYNEYSKQRRLDDGARNGLENQIRKCYRDENCFDPFPSNNEINAKRDCYRQTRDLLRKKMTECIKQDFKDFDLAEEDDFAFAWSQDEMALNAVESDSNACPPGTNRGPIRECTRNKILDTFNNHNPTKNVCDVRWDCIKQQNMDKTCYEKYQRAVQALCECSSKIDYQELKNKYSSCLSQRKFSVTNKDYMTRWLDQSKNRYCDNKNRLDSSCGGFGGNLDPSKFINALTGSGGSSNMLSSLLGGSSGSGSSSNGLSGLTNLFGGGSGNSLSSFTNLLGGGSSGFGSMLGGQGQSFDFLSGKKK